MMHALLRRTALVSVSLMSLSLGSPAQYVSYGNSFSSPVIAQMDTYANSGLGSRLIYRMILKKHGFTDAMLKDMSTEEMNQRIESGDYGEPKQAQASVFPASPSSRFKPTGKRIFLSDFVASLTKDRQQQEALAPVFAAGFEAYEKEAKRRGMENDLAGAMAYFIGSAYAVYQDGVAPDDAGLVMIARAIQIQYNTEEFRKIGDLEKQKFYELMVCLGTYLSAAYQTAIDTQDGAMKASLKGAAESTLKGFLKVDPSKVKITAYGLEMRQESLAGCHASAECRLDNSPILGSVLWWTMKDPNLRHAV